MDQALRLSLPQFSRARIQELIEDSKVLLDGKPAKASRRVAEGEVLTLEIPPEKSTHMEAQNLPVEVLFQDKHLAVLNKPAGLVVHPGAGNPDKTLVNALLFHLKDLQGIAGTIRPGIVHRLDKDTSGVMVVAKTQEALIVLQEAFKSREVTKVYRALVLGHPISEGTISTLYGRHYKNRVKFTGKVSKGKPAVTHFKVRKQFSEVADLEVTLETGRTHQIRVHCSELGFPLLGDALYGTKKSQDIKVIERQALHAWKLSFAHPKTGKWLNFEAPIPQDLKRALKLVNSIS